MMRYVYCRHGAEEAESEAPQRPKRQSAFRGSGYRLGETEEEETEVVQGGSVGAGPKKVNMLYNLFVSSLTEDLCIHKALLKYLFEPHHEKTNIVHMRKQRRRSASR